MSQVTYINGNRYSFANISLTIAGIPQALGVISSINYDATLEPGMVQGNYVRPVGRTEGQYQCTGDFEMLLSEGDDLEAALIQTGASGILVAEFDMVVSYAIDENDPNVITDTLIGCRIKHISNSNQAGTDAAKTKYELSVMDILKNGRPMV